MGDIVSSCERRTVTDRKGYDLGAAVFRHRGAGGLVTHAHFPRHRGSHIANTERQSSRATSSRGLPVGAEVTQSVAFRWHCD